MRKWIKKYGYRVTMTENSPLGGVSMRILEPKNIIGWIDSWLRRLKRGSNELVK